MKSSITPKRALALIPAPAVMFQPVSRRLAIGFTGFVKPTPTKLRNQSRELGIPERAPEAPPGNKARGLMRSSSRGETQTPCQCESWTASGLKERDTGDAGRARFDARGSILRCDAAQSQHGDRYVPHCIAKPVEPHGRKGRGFGQRREDRAEDDKIRPF